MGWGGIGSWARAESARVATRRRARPVRVLLVDETSIRRRHRYVTVVACGDTGKVLAMIDGRTKASHSSRRARSVVSDTAPSKSCSAVSHEQPVTSRISIPRKQTRSGIRGL